MKTKKLFFIALVLHFIGSAAMAQTAERKTYDYITIVADSRKSNIHIVVSINGVNYNETKFDNTQGWYDFNEVIKLIKNYEKEGYQLFSNNALMVGVIPSNYFLLRKEHKE